MSEEIALADATLSELARLTITITSLRRTITRQHGEITAERDARQRAEAVIRAWADPSAGHRYLQDAGCATCKALFDIADGTYQEASATL